MKQFITKNFVGIVALVLFLLLYLQRCGSGGPLQPPREIHDTTTIEIHHYHDSVIISKPTIIKQLPPSTIPPEAIPSPNFDSLLAQYKTLVGAYYAKYEALDSLKIDSLGVIYVRDTISKNSILGRSYAYHLDVRERITAITNTIYPPNKNKWYVGGGILGSKEEPVGGASVGIFINNKKDHLYGVEIEKYIGWPTIYSLSMYWKIKLHK